MTIISKQRLSNGYTIYDNYLFDTDYAGRRHASHYYNNKRGTYFRRLNTVWFETSEDGNRFYLEKLKEGFTKTYENNNKEVTQ